MTKSLIVEGWRSSSHSYALVNQHQLLHLCADPRFTLSHIDIPFLKPAWAQLDAGLGAEARRIVDFLPAPTVLPADAVYRISWPLRVHRGNAPRVFVFGTSELQRLEQREMCGPSGTPNDVDRDAVEIITPSNWSRAGFLASGFEEQRVRVIPHGVDAARFWYPDFQEKLRLRADMHIPADAHVFLSIGAMTWNKGIGLLLAAFALYRQQDERVILLLKGGDRLYGNLMQTCFAEASRLVPGGIPQSILRSIKYSGLNLSVDELARLYRLSDTYVSPYRAEGFNLPVLEALASGLLPIVTAGGSTDDFCPEHLSLKIAARPTGMSTGGQYLEPSLESLLECMRRARQDNALRARVGVDGPRWVAERYTWAHVTRSLADRLAA